MLMKTVSGKKTMDVADTTRQNQVLLLYADKGSFKEQPRSGCGITDMINGHSGEAMRRTIIEEMEREGMRVKRCKVTLDGDRVDIHLDAEYK